MADFSDPQTTRSLSDACRKCGAKSGEHCRHADKANTQEGALLGRSWSEHVIANRQRGGDFLAAIGLKSSNS